MSSLTCYCGNKCSVLSIIASLIIGIVTAFLRVTGVITVTSAFLWVVLGIAVVYLAVVLIVTALSGCEKTGSGCVCRTLSALLAGILGTALLSVVLLAVTFAATSIIGAIIAGALLFFVSLILTETACLVKCLAKCNN